MEPGSRAGRGDASEPRPDGSVGAVLVDAAGTLRDVSPAVRRLLPGAVGSAPSLAEAGDGLVDAATGREGIVDLVTAARRLRVPSSTVFAVSDPGPRLLHVEAVPTGRTGEAVLLVLQPVDGLRQNGLQHEALALLARSALRAETARELLQETAETVAATMRVPYVVILQRDGPRTLTTRAAYGWAVAPPHAIWSLPIEPGQVLARALDAPGPVVVPALAADASLARHGALRGSSSGGAVWVPIGGATTAYGLLGVLTAEPRLLRADEAAFLDSVARLLTAAVVRLEREERIRGQALHDGLTGLANRTLLQDRLEQSLALRRRAGGRVAVLVMDLDGFKEVNDTLGHAAGDEVLRTIARRVDEVTRRADTVGRLGGDEFAVVLSEVVDEEDALTAAEHLRDAVTQPMTVAGMDLALEGSVGIAIAPDHGESQGELLRRADAAMYRAKRTATGVRLYSAAEASPTAGIGRLAALRNALEDGQLVLHYQPEVDLRDGRVRSREALVRWQHPDEGLIPPRDFLPLVERSGLAVALTEYVLRQALSDAARWRAAGDGSVLTVNLSRQSLLATGIVDVALGALRDAGLAVTDLLVDVPETAVATDPAAALGALHAFAAAGIATTVDDFAVGPSLLPLLASVPSPRVKLAPQLVDAMEADGGGSAPVVRRLVDLVHDLGRTAVAEGVESDVALKALSSLECDAAQGYLLGRPEPIVPPPGRSG